MSQSVWGPISFGRNRVTDADDYLSGVSPTKSNVVRVVKEAYQQYYREVVSDKDRSKDSRRCWVMRRAIENLDLSSSPYFRVCCMAALNADPCLVKGVFGRDTSGVYSDHIHDLSISIIGFVDANNCHRFVVKVSSSGFTSDVFIAIPKSKLRKVLRMVVTGNQSNRSSLVGYIVGTLCHDYTSRTIVACSDLVGHYIEESSDYGRVRENIIYDAFSSAISSLDG